MISRASTSLSRLWQIRQVIRQHGLIDLLDQLNLSSTARFASKILFAGGRHSKQAPAVRIRLALEALGPVFIKLGQALSTRPDLLPAEIAAELAKLQDQVPAFSAEQAMQIIRREYGTDFEDIFESVEQQPLASASVAQVHAATLKEGNAIAGQNGLKNHEVIVKVLRPGIRKVIEKDLAVMFLLAGLLQKHWSRGQQFKPLEVIQDYANTINGELDLRREAANCSLMGANFEHTDTIYVPRIYWDYTQQEVLVMERIYGTSVRDVSKLESLGYDLQQLAADGVATFFKQAFEDNFFHADMHPGNIFVSDTGKWIAVDFGIMGVLSNSDKQYLAEMLLGFFNRDYRSIAEAHLRAEWIPADTQLVEFETAIRMVCEPNFAKPISEISFGVVLLQLFQTVRQFEMPLQPQLVLLYKTLLNIEGLGRQLYPQLNLWDTAKPFLENWMKQQLSPQVLLQDFKRDWPRWRTVLSDLPDHLQRLNEQSRQIDHGNEVLIKQIAEQARKSRITVFHQVFGFAIAMLAIVLAIIAESGYIQASPITEYAPWLAAAGLLWAYLRSR
ncbi:MAG: 2-polyprenylphenol 6-hydroxylase [Gammaproteobacteria bacterium]|nr:2-polyprenylphenol 6-hydroxylase [Gammaproteobacteria bacterium]